MWILIVLIIIILVPILAIANESDENKKYKKEMEPYEKTNNAMASIRCNHITGLPLTENQECIVSFCQDKIVTESNNSTFKLDLSKILDMNIKTTQEIQNSIGDAAMGYFFLGTLGATLGTQKQINRVFMILYKNKEDKESGIAFDLGNNINNLKYTSNYIEAFNTQIRKAKEVEL